MKTYTFNGHRVYLKKGEYRDNESLAVAMIKDTGEPFGTITANLDNPLQSEELAVLGCSHLLKCSFLVFDYFGQRCIPISQIIFYLCESVLR